MGRRILLAVLALFATAAVATAQTGGRIVGKVTSTDGRALPSINISVTGMNRGAVTDSAGRYSLSNVPTGAHNIQARGIGFGSSTSTVQIVAGQTATMNFALTATATELTPMVVTGYGEQERRIVTGAFSTVTSTQLQDIPTSDPMKALQGHVAGVEIVASSNEPGAAMNVRIRGVRSLTAPGARSGDGECKHVASAFVEGRCGGGDRSTTHLFSLFRDLALSRVMVPGAVRCACLCRTGGVRLKLGWWRGRQRAGGA